MWHGTLSPLLSPFICFIDISLPKTFPPPLSAPLCGVSIRLYRVFSVPGYGCLPMSVVTSPSRHPRRSTIQSAGSVIPLFWSRIFRGKSPTASITRPPDTLNATWCSSQKREIFMHHGWDGMPTNCPNSWKKPRLPQPRR